MIRVTVELCSARGREHDKVLGVCQITNDGETSFLSGGARGSYKVTLSKWAPKLKEIWMRGRVENFDRVSRGPWDLLYLALRACVGKRNADDAPMRRNPEYKKPPPFVPLAEREVEL